MQQREREVFVTIPFACRSRSWCQRSRIREQGYARKILAGKQDFDRLQHGVHGGEKCRFGSLIMHLISVFGP